MVERSLRQKGSCAATSLRTPHPQLKILIIMITIILIIITILFTVAAYVSQKWEMGCRGGGDPLSLELRMGRSQKGCCAGTLLPQAVLNHVDLIILSPTSKITGPTSIFALCPTAAFAARLYRSSSGCFFLVACALI